MRGASKAVGFAQVPGNEAEPLAVSPARRFSASPIPQRGVPQLSFHCPRNIFDCLNLRPVRVIWWLAGLLWEETELSTCIVFIPDTTGESPSVVFLQTDELRSAHSALSLITGAELCLRDTRLLAFKCLN